MMQPPVTAAAAPWWPVVTAFVTVVGSGIMTFFVARAAAARGVRDELAKRREQTRFDERRAWFDSATQALLAFDAVVAEADAALRRDFSTESRKHHAGRMRTALQELRRALLTGVVHAPMDLLDRIASIPPDKDRDTPTASKMTAEERLAMFAQDCADMREYSRQVWMHLATAARTHLGHDDVP